MCQVIDRALRDVELFGSTQTDVFGPGSDDFAQWVEFEGEVLLPLLWSSALAGMAGAFVGPLTVKERHGGRVVATHYLNTARIGTASMYAPDLNRVVIRGTSIGPYETMPTDAREP